jgi:uncharacterized protein (TIGR00730 family)
MPVPKITVFGGSMPRPGEAAYRQAQQLGCSLAEKGFTVITGGYIGTMEAVSRGAAEAGGHVIGVTCDEIEAWRPVGPNPWVLEERRYPTVRQRLYALIDLCDAALALPGGIGTLVEIGAMWSQLQVKHANLPRRPLLLIGSGWKVTFETFINQQGMYVAEKDRSLIQFVEDEAEAVNRLSSLLVIS